MHFLAFLHFELAACRARIGESLTGAALLVIAATLFAMAQPVGGLPLPVATAALWMAVFLILSIVQFLLFERDRRNGLLEQWPLMPLSLEWLFIAKAVAHWVAFALPLLLALPVASALLQIAPEHWLGLVARLGAGSLCFVFVSAMAAAAALRFRSGETIGILLCLPLALPVAVFGAEARGTLLIAAFTLALPPLCAWIGGRLLRYLP